MYQFNLSYESDSDLDSVVLYEDGIPLPHDIMSFLDAQTIQVTDADPSKSYAVDYNRLTRFETPILSLPENYTDYIWFADYVKADRLSVIPESRPISRNIQFGFDYTAYLGERADLSGIDAQLIADDGKVARPVPWGAWEFVNPMLVQISPSAFNPDALYTLNYSTRYIVPTPYCQVMVELRQADNMEVWGSAQYRSIEVNELVETSAFFQMRATIYGVQDPADVKLYSLLLKGMSVGYISRGAPVTITSPAPDNLAGIFTADDFGTGTRTNLNIIAGTPARFSYLQPSLASRVVGEPITQIASVIET